MKTKENWFLKDSKWILKLLNGITNIAWYGNMVLIAFAFVVMSIAFFSDSYSDFDCKVKYPLTPVKESFQSVSDNVKDISIESDAATLRMKIKNTIPYVSYSYLYFAMFEILVMVIIFNLRKFFRNLNKNMTFKQENIRLLRITALCFLLFFPLNGMNGVATHLILSKNVVGYHDQFWMMWSDNLITISIGLVIFIMADVFKHGFIVQTENEGYV